MTPVPLGGRRNHAWQQLWEILLAPNGDESGELEVSQSRDATFEVQRPISNVPMPDMIAGFEREAA